MSEPLSMAVVGVGHFGRYHAQKIARLPGVRLTALADLDGDRAATVARELEAEGAAPEPVTDHRALLGRVDAVSVVVPTLSHVDIALEFIESGADVLVEKPIANDLQGGRRLVEAARRHGRILQVGHLERFSGVAESLRESLNRPLFIDSVRIGPFKPRGTDVSVILDLMIHDLDLILSLVDAPILSVDAAGAPVFSEREDIASARLKFDNGCIANITASRISLKTERRMRIFQPDAYISVDFDKRAIRTVRKGSGASPFPGVPPVAIAERDYSEGDPLEREMAAFVAAVRARSAPIVSGEDGLRALDAAIQVTESLRRHAAFVERVVRETPDPAAAS